MADNVQDAIVESLKGIQSSIAQLRSDVEHRLKEVGERFDKLEAGLRKDRRNSAGMLVMMRATAGHFDERVTELEDRMDRVDRRRS